MLGWSVVSQRGMNRPREIYPQAERDGGLTSRASQEPAPLGLVYEVRKSWGSGASSTLPKLVTWAVTLKWQSTPVFLPEESQGQEPGGLRTKSRTH